MGWSGGSDLLWTIWSIVRGNIAEGARPQVLRKIISEFESEDADTIWDDPPSWPEVSKTNPYSQES